MNSKILTIIGREYSTRVRKKTFIILTIVTPFLFAALIALPILLGAIKDSDQKTIVIVDQTHRYEKLFKDTPQYHFQKATAVDESFRDEETDAQAVLLISGNLAKNPDAAVVYSREEVQLELRHTIEDILADQIRNDKLAAYDVPELETIIADVEQDFTLQTRKWSDDGTDTESSFDAAMIIGLAFTLLIYMFVMTYGSMVMQGVMEEKTNRIIEVMVSSVKPFQLMMGKILGVLLVGLTQIAIWGIMLVILISAIAYAFGGDAAAEVLAQSQQASAPTAVVASQPAATPADAAAPSYDILSQVSGIPVVEVAIMFVLYFLGGYLLYASLFAACGAAVNSPEDSSQFMMPLLLIMIFALYGALGSMENTNGPLAFWASLFPFTSPIVMMIRVPFDIPLWQELLSLVILYATAIFFVWVGARIYRVGILMYGKKPTLRELWKWLRYS
ncbi:MAG: ABC transporter permease [Bacteroidaceae bacterium]|nr:ABC transporter permease [Bacteroidaceae bacterium]